MTVALGLGRRGAGRCWPNPAVGCIIVSGDRVVGRGWTQPGGRPHAEAMALAAAGSAARGATAIVTLEPCAHTGKTPPCADALIAAGIARVIVATGDPDARVAGAGLARLRAAGVEVIEGICKREADRDHRGFFTRLLHGRPAVTLKLATSLDGRIATATGESQWITGPTARRAVHGARARHDAVMVGGGTARADDPTLTVRDMGITHQPVRVVLSRRLDIPETGALARTAREVPVWLCHGEDADADAIARWADRGARLIEVPLMGRQLDTAAALQALGAAGLNSVYCEGGGALAASLLNAGLVDRLLTHQAGVALGAEGQPAIGAMGLDRLAEAPRFTLVSVRPLGPDAELEWARA